MTSAEVCIVNGWKPGDVLEGRAEGADQRVRITAIGDFKVLGRWLAYRRLERCPCWMDADGHELLLDLTLRDWRKIDTRGGEPEKGS